MMKIYIRIERIVKLLILNCLFCTNLLFGQDIKPNWVVDTLNNPSPGYISIHFSGGDNFFLVDNYGDEIYKRTLKDKMAPFRFLDNGNWLLQGKKSYYIMNQNFQLIDSFPFPPEYKFDFHEVVMLENGNLIGLFMENVVVDLSKYVEGGSQTATLKSAVIVELDNKGEIKWSWKALEHFDILDVTEDIDLTQNTIDFSHANSICEDLDGNLIVSFRNFDEITKINKSTGEIIWRMGGSKCKNNQFTFENDDNGGFFGFSHQHTAKILPNGNLLLYDNGNLREPNFSRAVEYQVDQVNKKVVKVWEYRNSPDIFSKMMGSVKRLPNGNTLINWGFKKLTEVKPDNTIALELTINNPKIISVYRADKVYSHLDVVSKKISQNNEFYFADNQFDTGIKLDTKNVTGSDTLTVQYHKYKPSKAEYQDSSFVEVVPARWVLSSENEMNIDGKISINPKFIDSNLISSKLSFFKRNMETKGVFEMLQTSVNSTNEVEANFKGLGEFVLVSYKLPGVNLKNPEMNATGIGINDFLIWDSTKGAEYYHLQVSTSSDFDNLIINEKLNDLSAKYNYSELEYNTKYYWRVRAISIKDTGNWSDVYDFKTALKAPESLTPDNGEVVDNKGKLNWNNHYSGMLSSVQIARDSEFVNLVNDTSDITDNVFEFELASDELYHWRVKTYSEDNSSSWSNSAFFRTKDPSCIDDTDVQNNDVIYPLPANEYIYLNDENLFEQQYQIIDIKGNIILEDLYLDGILTKNIPKGTYFLIINNKKYKFVK